MVSRHPAPTIGIVTPAARGQRTGNRATALRIAGLLRQLGCRPFVCQHWAGRRCELLLAVHAGRSADSVAACARAAPARPIVVLLAGTDLYPQFQPEPATLRALQLATRLVALQPHAVTVLPPELRVKVRMIQQSATALPGAPPAAPFQVCMLAHLRAIKRPLLVVQALALLPPAPAIRVLLAGTALEPALAEAARAAAVAEPRFSWLGELSRRAAKTLLAGSHACLVTSVGEGGANVVSEAIAAGTPLLASAIPGNTGILGEHWPGLFAADDAAALATLLARAAGEPAFLAELRQRTRALLPSVAPAGERDRWRQLLQELGVTVPR
ncbi:MAG TPA: selenoneine biosynthesis selenosugar synthase SenB [Planctomycetota bacterium]|nr:selenoneine biosynthesis selenosugar synthase SenB [Planctomycetota bacterium]